MWPPGKSTYRADAGLLVTGPGRVRGAGRIGEILAAAAPATD